MLRRIAIVGASLAGLRAAETLRDRGFDGELTLIGDEPHRPYDRPPLSKQVLQGTWEPEQTFFRRKDGYDALALDMRLGVRADAVDLEALSPDHDSTVRDLRLRAVADFQRGERVGRVRRGGEGGEHEATLGRR